MLLFEEIKAYFSTVGERELHLNHIQHLPTHEVLSYGDDEKGYFVKYIKKVI